MQPIGEDTPSTVILCPGDIRSYSCSLLASAQKPMLEWHVSYPGKQPVTITYTSASTRNKKTYSGLGLSIVTTLRPSRKKHPPHMVSTLTLIVVREVSLYGTEVKCTVRVHHLPHFSKTVIVKHNSQNQGMHMG